jgi:hypothetical protein
MDEMIEKKRLLMYFLADIMSDDSVMDRFLENPEATMQDYELSEQQKSTLYSLDAHRIGSLVGAEAQLGLENAVLSPQWPVPESRVRAIEPSRVPAGLVPEFQLYGEGLMRGAEVVLRPLQGSGPDLVFQAKEASGTFQETRLTVQQMDLSCAAAGRYRVCLRNFSGANLIENAVELLVA